MDRLLQKICIFMFESKQLILLVIYPYISMFWFLISVDNDLRLSPNSYCKCHSDQDGFAVGYNPCF